MLPEAQEGRTVRILRDGCTSKLFILWTSKKRTTKKKEIDNRESKKHKGFPINRQGTVDREDILVKQL